MNLNEKILYAAGFLLGVGLSMLLLPRAHGAEIVAVGENSGGGLVIFSDVPCVEKLYTVIAYTPKILLSECWIVLPDQGVVRVYWSDDSQTDYPLELFEPAKEEPNSKEWEA